MYVYLSGWSARSVKRNWAKLSLQIHGKVEREIPMKAVAEKSEKTKQLQPAKQDLTHTQQGLKHVEFVGKKFIKLVPTTVKHVPIKRVSVPCVERKFWTQRTTSNLQFDLPFHYFWI